MGQMNGTLQSRRTPLNNTFGRNKSRDSLGSAHKGRTASIHSSTERLHTPTSVHSRKSSSFNISSKRISSMTASSNRMGKAKKPDEDGLKYQIFTTMDDSPFVICTPPFSSTQVGFTHKTLREKLLT